jgi:acetate kinase
MFIPTPGQLILAINTGASSIKFALFRADDETAPLLEGCVAGVGGASAQFSVRGATVEPFSRHLSVSERVNAGHVLIDWLAGRIDPAQLGAIGHRVVHGGPGYWEPQELTVAMRQDLHKLSSFDPEHLPLELAMVDALHLRFPHVPQVACFDTAFHHAMAPVARRLPIPRRYEAHGVRRYGFHGLSCAFLIDELERVAGKPAAHGRVLLAHLGGGASVTAVRDGKSVDTSMGLTAAGGMPMGTRAGDLDPGLAWYLARNEQMTPAAFNHMVNHESGLLGMSETTADMRELLAAQADDARAADAVALFCYQAGKTVAAMAATLAGLDTLVFAGGIGENAPEVRERICAPLAFIGIRLDPARNADNAAVISAAAAAVSVRVIATDEQRMIVHHVRQLLARAHR